MFSAFKSFDKDGDGYISYKDFVERAREMHIDASNKQILATCKMLDLDNDGYVDFNQFS